MYISVIPTAHSLTDEPFAYHVPELWQDQITLWGLVEIPIGNHLDLGIIAMLDITVGSDIEIRPIHSVISMTPLLAPYQIDYICQIAVHWRMPIHRVLGMFLPKSLLTRLEKSSYVLTPGVRNISPPERTYEIMTDQIVTRALIESRIATPSVVILPDDLFLWVYEASSSTTQYTTKYLYQSATIPRRHRVWQEAYEGKYDILVWTRRLLYYNLNAFSKVYFIEDAFAREIYAYPQSLDTIELLRLFSACYDGSIEILTSTPAIATLKLIKSAHYQSNTHETPPRAHH